MLRHILQVFASKFFSPDSQSYVCRMGDLSREDIFMKRELVSFFEDLGYVVGGVPHNPTLKK